MVTVKCYYEDGDTITTQFNGTEQEARDYFEGQVFNIGSVYDNLQRCIKVELVS